MASAVKLYYSMYPLEFVQELDSNSFLKTALTKREFDLGDSYLSTTNAGHELLAYIRQDRSALRDVSGRCVDHKTDPVTFICHLTTFPRVKALGRAVFGCAVGSVANERLWKILSAVESKKRGSLKVQTSDDQVFLSQLWKSVKNISELQRIHKRSCTCSACKK